MFWVQLVILQICIVIGLILFLRYMLTRNIHKATGRLEELSKDYALKQEEINKRLKEAQDEGQNIVMKERQEAEEMKRKVLAEAEAAKEKIIEEARQKAKEITEKAQRNSEFLKREIEQRIEARAVQKASELLAHALPETLLQEIHHLMMNESTKGEFELKRLNLPEDIHDAKILSAFPLTHQEQADLHERLKKRVNGHVSFQEQVDPGLMAGFVITIGSIVIDASLRNKIQKAAKA